MNKKLKDRRKRFARCNKAARESWNGRTWQSWREFHRLISWKNLSLIMLQV